MDPAVAHGVAVWSSAAWRNEAVTWLDEQLAAVARRRTGAVEQPHLRPWATVLRAPTGLGPVWMKAASPGTAYEVAIYGLLAKSAPEHVLTPVAVDVARGWIVLPDGGMPLDDRRSGAGLARAMEAVLPQYGQLQRDLAPHAEELVALGAPDMRASVMPARFEEALAAVGEHVARRGEPAEEAAHRRVATMGDTVARWCDQLAGAPGPPSLDHNDLHPTNVIASDGGRARFYDWGDSVVAHPFASMLVGLGFLQRRVLGVDIGDPRAVRLRDAYLEAFGDLAPHAELVETLELACRVGKIARSLIWDRVVRTLGPGEYEEWVRAPLATLASLADDDYLGGA